MGEHACKRLARWRALKMGLMMAPPWGYVGISNYKPRATHGANDLRTFGAQ